MAILDRNLIPEDIIDRQRKLSVVEHRDPMGAGVFSVGTVSRGPLVAAYGTRQRERDLLALYRNDYNTTFKSGVAGMSKRLLSTPWFVDAAGRWSDYFQSAIMHSDFGSWENFVPKVVKAYCRYDTGAFIETIAPGDPDGPPTGPIAGFAVLDTLRCYPTGNPEYPVLYYDIKGQLHRMHHTRVTQLYDGAEDGEDRPGYGECALTRAIGPVWREILMSRYREVFLDDKPPPGFTIFGNVDEAVVRSAIRKMETERSVDSGGIWGSNVQLYGLDSSIEPKVQFITYSGNPEKFDYEKEKATVVKEIALALNMDIQDLWELTGSGGLGTGTQSEILAQKSRGKLFGRLLKGFERFINQGLPEDAEWKWQYKDAQEDMEDAQKAQSWANTVQFASVDLSKMERRQLLANQIPAFKDVLLDAEGQMRRLPDDDPKAAGQAEHTKPPAIEPEEGAESGDTGAGMGQEFKSFSDTGDTFIAWYRSLVVTARASGVRGVALYLAVQSKLLQLSQQAYDDGMREAGVDPDGLPTPQRLKKKLRVVEFMATNDQHVRSLVDNISDREVPDAVLFGRAEMWVRKSLQTIYFAGLQDAAQEGDLYQWQLGRTLEHCKTCLMLNGQVHPIRSFTTRGYQPGSSSLECKGYNCDCRLVHRPDLKREVGTLPAKKIGLRDRLTSWLRGLLGGPEPEAQPDAL